MEHFSFFFNLLIYLFIKISTSSPLSIPSHSPHSLSSSLSSPKSSQGFLLCGKFKFLPPPSRSRKVSIQTDWIPKSQYMQTKQDPAPLSMASQSAPMSATFRESGLITCSFSPSPVGLGELSFDQSPCISG